MNSLKLKILLAVLSVFGVLLVVAIFSKSDLFAGLTGIFLLIYLALMIWFPSSSIGEKG